MVQRTAFRVVREALTNVHKHAPGAEVTVRIRYGTARLQVTIRNGAPAGPGLAGAGIASTGSGLGIATLRRRVELPQGTLTAGTVRDGGFCVEAVLPAYLEPGYGSEATVKGYVSRMLVKLDCANRTQAGLLAHDAGIVFKP
jgi:signal transduction histidine kinase